MISPRTSHTAVYAFITLQLFGSISFILITFLAEVADRKTTRYPPWWSFCVSWIIFGISYSILSPAGMQFSHPPNHTLCAFQAALIYAAPPLVANATLALIIQLRSVVRHVLQKVAGPMSKGMHLGIVVIPWLLWTFNVLGIFLYGFLKPRLVRMNGNGTYCDLDISMISKVVASWLAAVAIVIVGLESKPYPLFGFALPKSCLLLVSLVVAILRLGLRLFGECDASSTVVRLGVFLSQAVICLGLAILFIVTKHRPVASDVLIAIQPILAAVIFGTKASLFCISSRKKPGPDDLTTSSTDLDDVIVVGPGGPYTSSDLHQ